MAFFVAKAYACITHKGSYSSFTSGAGFVWEPTKFTFREMAELVLSQEFTLKGELLTTGWYWIDGSTEREESLHIAWTSPYEQRAYQRLLRLKTTNTDPTPTLNLKTSPASK